MKTKNNLFNIKTILFLCLLVTMFNACDKDDDQTYDKTRLFRPVLNQNLFSEGNTIVVNMGKLKGAVGYTIEVSRDSFATIEYTIPSDTNYVEINENTNGKNEELFWNTIYQVRATAHEANAEFDSRISDFGSVRTQRFPSILNVPATYDVIDVTARVTWEPLGDAITGIKVFGPDDLRLQTPLFPETPVTEEEFLAGEAFVEGLEPASDYQIAIYSGSELRGWVNYTTLEAELDYTTVPNLIDLREDLDPGAVSSALNTSPDGATILVSRGSEYDAPGMRLDKSVTIRAAYGFGEQRAKLMFPSNFDLETDANVDHLRFVDLELRGTDWGGKYVINISKAATLNEFKIDNCYVTNFRGIFRQKDNPSIVNNYIINNSVVDSINGYGVAACDKDTAELRNIQLTNSTFNHTIYFLISRNNSESILIDNCTLANINESGRQMFRWRGGDGKDNVTNGITITNSIFGHSWDTNESEVYSTRGRQGLDNTVFNINNTFTVSDFSWTSNPIEALPIGNAGKSQQALWVDPANSNFNFLGSDFIGRFTTGDPRWRVKL
ncbi:DUF4957 domain-containing protein [Flavisericum labens]|uniref:DUF4957 domain-containing protein n=1 Tax=Flavisericum labens TaxID=3377112 RepID=UPI00387B829F